MSRYDHQVLPMARDERSAPFFDAAARGALMLRYSPSADAWSTPGAVHCEHSYADDLQWRESSGRGTLVSWTVLPARTRGESTKPAIPIGVVELAEGPWITVQLVEVGDTVLRVGLPTTVDFVQPPDSEWIPVGVVGAP